MFVERLRVLGVVSLHQVREVVRGVAFVARGNRLLVEPFGSFRVVLLHQEGEVEGRPTLVTGGYRPFV